MPHRIEKFASTLKHALGEILLYELDNPDFKTVSINSVTVTADLKNAIIQVSSFSTDLDRIVDELTRAKSLIKQRLAKKMYLKYLPEITFQKDTGFEFDQKLSGFFKEKPNE